MKKENSKINLCDDCKFELAFCKADGDGVKFGAEGKNNVTHCTTFERRNFKTPIEKIFFRSSRVGLLLSGIINGGLTETQKEEKARLEAIPKTLIGLTERQAEELKKLKAKEKVTDGQAKKITEYEGRMKTFKKLTPKQEDSLAELTHQESQPPQLSQGAKTYVKEVWLQNEKGFKEEITSKHTRKGLQAEEDAINLISFVDGVMYVKNETPAQKGHLTGVCDINHVFKTEEAGNLRVVDDTKCSWNPKTFMAATMSPLYEGQGRAYMYLYDADIFRLRYCLVDCPPEVYNDELRRFSWQYNIVDITLPEYADLVKQFEANFLYEHSGRYTKEERVKTFAIERDFEIEEKLLLAVDLAVDYYQTITLNMIE